MAKGKHSTALFEVIHSAGRPERVAQRLRTPNWWFKGRPAGSDTITETHETPSFSDPEAAPQPDPAPARTTPSSRSNHRSRSSAVHVEFDRDRQELTLRLRYTTAIVGAFTVCVLLALAYVAGRHIGGPQSAAADGNQIARLREQPPQQGVTDVTRRRTVTQVPHEANLPADPPRRTIEQQPAQPKAHETPSLVPAGVESQLPRTVGLNYVIIQTYPKDRRDAADQALEYFTKSGIPCTLVSLETTRKDWICLVGTAGFTRISSLEYKNYTDNIVTAGRNSKSAKFDQLQPYGYKWKGTEQSVN